MAKGYEPILHLGTVRQAAEMTEILGGEEALRYVSFTPIHPPA